MDKVNSMWNMIVFLKQHVTIVTFAKHTKGQESCQFSLVFTSDGSQLCFFKVHKTKAKTVPYPWRHRASICWERKSRRWWLRLLRECKGAFLRGDPRAWRCRPCRRKRTENRQGKLSPCSNIQCDQCGSSSTCSWSSSTPINKCQSFRCVLHLSLRPSVSPSV